MNGPARVAGLITGSVRNGSSLASSMLTVRGPSVWKRLLGDSDFVSDW